METRGQAKQNERKKAAKVGAPEEDADAEQKANYQTLEAKMNEVVQLLATQKEEHRKEMKQQKERFAKQMEQLEAKNRKLEEKLNNVEMQTAKNGALNAKMEQFQGYFSKMLTEEQKQLMAQFQSNILANPKRIVWAASEAVARCNISESHLKIKATGSESAIATVGYTISGENCRKENSQFPGTILFNYEVTMSSYGYFSVYFTDGSNSYFVDFADSPNSYGIAGSHAKIDSFWLSGKQHKLECPTGIIDGANVIGSGLLLNSKNELAVFFTRDGNLLVKQVRIKPTVDRLYPTVSISGASVEANFGGNLVAKPFGFDTDKWPGLVFE